MEYELIISELFQQDLDKTIEYISLILHSPVAAANLLKNTEKTVENIQSNPYMYSLSHIESVAAKGYRNAVVGNYNVFYKVNSELKKYTYTD